MQPGISLPRFSFRSSRGPLTRKFCQFVQPTGHERTFQPDQLIVTKTDLKGRITYANRVFCDIAGVSERQALGVAHSIIRHPDMPRSVFKLLWDTLADRREIFAYVVNLASNGDHYWVFAHVTPSFDHDGRVTGYHSNRRVPERRCLVPVIELYRMLKGIEDGHEDRGKGMLAALDRLQAILRDKGVGYDEFIFSL